MKSLYTSIYGVLCFLVSTTVLYAQEDTNLNPVDEFTYESHQTNVEEIETLPLSGVETATASETATRSSSSGIGETPGALSVSLTGGANYTVPIAVPPGVTGVAPSIAISYNSQGGNGSAGWGWNLSGISSITRIPANTYHDGTIDPVDFDTKDRFALDGQRLILKSGTYGANGAVYQTEKYSNLKITSHGTSPYGASYGPAYFIVKYPDGSTAYYGNGNGSRSRLEYAMYVWDNPQGIRINYHYKVISGDNNTISIDKITYGAKSAGTPINEIRFEYKTRSRLEQSFVGNVDIQRKNILKGIKVFGNGTPYRNYVIGHNTSGLGYDRVASIQEKTGDNSQAHSPITFTYPTTFSSVGHTQVTSNLGLVNIEKRTAAQVSLDLTGNGKTDFLIYPRTDKNKLWLFKNNDFRRTYTINTGVFEDVFPVKLLNDQNKLLPGMGLTVIQRSGSRRVNLKVYSNEPSNALSLQYTKGWSLPTYNDQNSCESTGSRTRTIPQRYVSGDFNGDGLSDVIAISKPYSFRSCIPEDPCDSPIDVPEPGGEENNTIRSSNCCYCDSYPSRGGWVSFINLDRRITSGYSNRAGRIRNTIKDTDQILTMDVNGDGKTDIVHLTKSRAYIYMLNSSNELEFISETASGYIKTSTQPLVGDYNGDGKGDIMIPDAANSNRFNILLSRGTQFYVTQRAFNFSYGTDYYDPRNGQFDGYNLIPVDINGDGKTDIIDYRTVTKNSSSTGTQEIRVYNNKNTNGELLQFTPGGNKQITSSLKHYPLPMFLSADQRNGSLEFASISNQSISSFSFALDHRKDMALLQVSNNGVEQRIYYGDLVSVEPQDGVDFLYTRGLDQIYPYADVVSLPGIKLVSYIERKVPQASDISTLRQDFHYKGAVTHLGGLGFIGFQYTSRSNWHADDGYLIYDNTTFDLQRRGAVTDTYSTPYTQRFGSIPSDYITKTKNVYEYTEASNKSFTHTLTSSTTQNQLEGTSTSSHYIYDAYNNPTQETVNYSGHGSTVTELTYTNSTGSPYYIGRPTHKKVTSTIGANSFSTEEDYSYTGALLTTKKVKGNGTQFNTETYTHDEYGNITGTTITPYGEASRTTAFKYDPSHRFIEKSTDIDGLETTFAYDPATGTLKTETDPFNFVTSYLYDKWNRVTHATDYLGNTTTTTYTESGNYYTVTSTAPDGSSTSSRYDPLKRKVNDRSKGLGGQWTQVSYGYDKLGRLEKQSEPHFGSAPTQWNTTEYDFYGRVKSQLLYTGKSINYTYNELITTVDDGTKSVTTTKDAMGNVVQLDDPGGSITYTYFGNGALKSSSYGGVTQTIEQDGWGRKTKLTDPSAGVYTYAYDGYGQVIKETNPKGSTEYTYLPTGRVQQTKTTGDHTRMTTNYVYDNTTKLLTAMTASDAINGTAYTYGYDYDDYLRPDKVTEDTGTAQFEKAYTYDSYGRPLQESYSAQTAGNASTNSYTYTYDSHGAFTGFNNWAITSQNARGQITGVQMGTGETETNTYDAYGFLTTTEVFKPNADAPHIQNSYDFNAQRGTLTSRTLAVNAGANSLTHTESFEYDSQDRLLKGTSPFGRTNAYDAYGRITTNSAIGAFAYQEGDKRYQLKEMTLNEAGAGFYKNRERQQITYNAFKKPVEIHEAGKGRVSFEYGPMHNRTRAWYGGVAEDKNDRRYHKQYSSIIPAEIVHDKEQNSYKFVFFTGGDAYSAPIARIEKFTNGTSDGGAIYHLQRDYLGSILNITKQGGDSIDGSGLVEHRQFGAWGTVDGYWSTATDSDTMGYDSILDRGYTGHEHFYDLGLIHMNGRIYDPQMGRFLSPDNYVQDPYNTQNYNRYGYVLNNPLIFVDYTGEWAGVDDIIAGAIGGLVNLGVNIANGNLSGMGFWETLGKGAAAFGSGAAAGVLALYGPAGWAAGGAIVSGTNSWLSGNEGWDIVKDTGIGAVSGLAGGAIGKYTAQFTGVLIRDMKVTSPLLQGMLGGALGSGITSGALNFGSALIAGASFDEALQAGGQGALSGLATGAIVGAASAIAYSRVNGVNAFNGKSKIDVPKDWTQHSSKKGNGIVFKDPKNPHNSIRQMPGNPNSPNPSQQNPYIKFMKNGIFYDAIGNPLPNGNVPSSHIPVSRFNINKMPKF